MKRKLFYVTLVAFILSLLLALKVSAHEIPENNYNITDETMETFARLVFAEAGNQSLLGKRYVVDVVLNRVDSTRFKESTIMDVIYARGQFSPVRSSSFTKITPTDDCYEAIRLELAERSNSEILFFNAHGYVLKTTPVLIEGDHYFSK